MIPDRFSTLSIIVIVISTLMLFLSHNWRVSILGLIIQYLAVFILMLQVWPIGLSAVKLVAGWMAGAILAAAQSGKSPVEEPAPKGSWFLFRLLLSVLVWILVLASSSAVIEILPLSTSLVMGAILLIGMGLVQLGISTRPMRVLLGLFTFLSGFELIYAAVESSVLLAGLMAVITVGLALVGSYLFDELSEAEDIL